MHLKSTPIFLVISLLSVSLLSNVYAFTDAELTNMYRGITDSDTMNNIQNAIDHGSLKCSDLPENIIIVSCQDSSQKFQELQNNVTQILHPDQKTEPQASVTQSSSGSGLMLLPILMIVPVALILTMKIVLGGDGFHMPRIFMKPKAKKNKPNVKQYATFIKEDESNVDMSTLDDHSGIISNREYLERHPRPQKERTEPISTSHKFLLSLGLMKVKKK